MAVLLLQQVEAVALRRACRRAAMVLAEGELEMTKCLELEGGASVWHCQRGSDAVALEEGEVALQAIQLLCHVGYPPPACRPPSCESLAVAFCVPAAGLALPTPAGRVLFSFSCAACPCQQQLARWLASCLGRAGGWSVVTRYSGFNACRFSLQACSCASRVLECCCISPNGQCLWRTLQLNTARLCASYNVQVLMQLFPTP